MSQEKNTPTSTVNFDSLNKRMPKNGIIIGNGKDCDRYLHVLAVA